LILDPDLEFSQRLGGERGNAGPTVRPLKSWRLKLEEIGILKRLKVRLRDLGKKREKKKDKKKNHNGRRKK